MRSSSGKEKAKGGKQTTEAQRPKPKCKIIQEGVHPHPGPQPDKVEDEEAVFETINLTPMEKNGHLFLARAVKNAVALFQEHKMKPAAIFKMKEVFKESGLKMLRGPCDQTTRTTNVGVGIVAQNNVSLIRAEIKCEAFKLAYEVGMVDTYLVDLGWE